MAKVILVCGKICSGKSYYSKLIKDSFNAVIISPDEATYELINNEQGEFYNIFSERGLWTKKDREKTVKYYKDKHIDCEIHYVSVDDETWKKNIAERNKRVEAGNGGSDFYLDEGLMKKLESFWEEPTEDEIDVLYKVKR